MKYIKKGLTIIFDIIMVAIIVLAFMILYNRVINHEVGILKYSIVKIDSSDLKEFKAGDYILIKKEKELKVGDIITYKLKENTQTERVHEIRNNFFVPSSDNQVAEKEYSKDDVIGTYQRKLKPSEIKIIENKLWIIIGIVGLLFIYYIVRGIEIKDEEVEIKEDELSDINFE